MTATHTRLTELHWPTRPSIQAHIPIFRGFDTFFYDIADLHRVIPPFRDGVVKLFFDLLVQREHLEIRIIEAIYLRVRLPHQTFERMPERSHQTRRRGVVAHDHRTECARFEICLIVDLQLVQALHALGMQLSFKKCFSLSI